MPHKKPTVSIALINDKLFHHGCEIVIGAKNWCNQNGNVRTRVISVNTETIQQNLDKFLDKVQFDAAITFATDPKLLRSISKITPKIINTCSAVQAKEFPNIIVDDNTIGKEAANYFIRRHYQSFAHISKPTEAWLVQRNAGFLTQLKAMGHHSVEIPIPWSEATQSLEHLINLPRPLAVFAPSDPIARSLTERLLDFDVHIPRDIAVIGADDDPYFNRLCSIPLSSVRLPGQRVGELAAEMAYTWVTQNKKPKPVTKLNPIGVETRLSSDIAFCDDELVTDALELISEHIKELTCTDDLVEKLQVPRRTLEWHFRKELGHSIHEELGHARIEKARSLLATTHFTCEEVAHKVGLSEGRILTLLFKRKLGLTPSEYRGTACNSRKYASLSLNAAG